MPRAGSLRWVAWSGATLGALLILFGWISTPAPGSNYADVLASQAWRIEVGMWVSAGIGIGIPVIVWLLPRACRVFGRNCREPGTAERGNK